MGTHGALAFTSPLPDGKYRLTISKTNVTDLAGNGMAADFAYDFFILTADANHDGVVDTSDFTALASHFNQSGATYAQGDFNYDGSVNALDFNLLGSRFGYHQSATAIDATPPVNDRASIVPSTSLFSDKPVSDIDDMTFTTALLASD